MAEQLEPRTCGDCELLGTDRCPWPDMKAEQEACGAIVKKPRGEDMTSDPVEAPAHYVAALSETGVEMKDIMKALGWKQGFYRGSSLKYLMRAGRKGGPEDERQDLQKAIRCLEIALEEEE